MSEKSKIEWTTDSFNIVHGCSKVSEGCRYCYAEARDHRHLYAREDHWGPNSSRLKMAPKYWQAPLAWNRKAARLRTKTMVFCSSMADVFEDHPDLPSERQKLWPLIEQTPHLIWQILTKRPQNVSRMVPDTWQRSFPSNVWMMTTAENQVRFDERIVFLKEIPASVLGLSCEPLLGAIDFGHAFDGFDPKRLWVIAGGESSNCAAKVRPSEHAWFAGLRDQCQERGIPFFFKQWGNRYEDGQFHRDKSYRLLDGREWNEYPESE